MPEAKTIAEKMHFKPGFTIRAINRPSGYTELLGGLPVAARVIDEASPQVDVVHLFVESRAALLEQLPGALAGAPDGAVVWVSYPKRTRGRTPDINRDIIIEQVPQFGWRTVSNIALGDDWSSIRLRPR